MYARIHFETIGNGRECDNLADTLDFLFAMLVEAIPQMNDVRSLTKV